MSIWRSIARIGGQVLLGGIGRRDNLPTIQGINPGVQGQMGLFPTVLPGVGQVLRTVGTATVSGAAFESGRQAVQRRGARRADGRPRRRRRINPSNSKALARALRRVNAWDRQRKRVDKALRKACPTPRRRRAPPRAR